MKDLDPEVLVLHDLQVLQDPKVATSEGTCSHDQAWQGQRFQPGLFKLQAAFLFQSNLACRTL